MPRFLVVEPMALVAEDLAECIREVVPDADVDVSLTVEAGMQLLQTGRPPIAFVNGDLLEGAAAPIAALCATVVAIGARQVNGWRVLDMPFSPETVRAVLMKVGGPEGPP